VYEKSDSLTSGLTDRPQATTSNTERDIFASADTASDIRLRDCFSEHDEEIFINIHSIKPVSRLTRNSSKKKRKLWRQPCRCTILTHHKEPIAAKVYNKNKHFLQKMENVADIPIRKPAEEVA
jgi:hypothetical protein